MPMGYPESHQTTIFGRIRILRENTRKCFPLYEKFTFIPLYFYIKSCILLILKFFMYKCFHFIMKTKILNNEVIYQGTTQERNRRDALQGVKKWRTCLYRHCKDVNFDFVPITWPLNIFLWTTIDCPSVEGWNIQTFWKVKFKTKNSVDT